MSRCELCGRRKATTFHHLIPRSCHTNKWFKKRFTKEEMKERGIDVCRDCHGFIHETFDEKTLGREYNTLESLLADEKVRKFVRWVRKQR